MLVLDASVRTLPGVGEKTAELMERLDIATVRDLLYHIPFRYEDFRAQKTISELEVGEEITLTATVHSITKFKTRRGMTVIRATLQDDTGKIAATWFNQPYLLMSLPKGKTAHFSGKITEYNKKPSLSNPTIEYEHGDRERVHGGRLVPIYPETAELSSRTLRNILFQTLDQLTNLEDPLPPEILKQYDFPSLTEALRAVHFPENEEGTEVGRHRMAFEEVYSLLTAARGRRTTLQNTKVPTVLQLTVAQRKTFEKALPFTLSSSQVSALLDLSLDLLKIYPAHRLIQGEVGSGKTIVAAFALYCAAINKANGVLVAPTQILASQHFATLSPIFEKLGIRTVFMTGGNDQATIEPGTIVIGTHAIFQHAKEIKPAVVVIDEEHRFGVEQRETFWKAKKKPHFFTMTATPIPRTVAHTILADRDVSYLEEIPSHKKDVTTTVVGEQARKKAYARIDLQIEQGAQVFIVCPFIEDSGHEALSNVKSAEQMYLTIKKIFAKRRVKLVHGKTPKDERQTILENMREGKVDILVATPIIEVGIDIPHASIIVIEGAERFGLAQLHQLRGRVGRIGQKAYCLLIPSEGISATKRLKILEKETNGNVLAEQDLKIRGTGELLGTRQHGWDTLKFASWFDEKLIQECKEAVENQS